MAKEEKLLILPTLSLDDLTLVFRIRRGLFYGENVLTALIPFFDSSWVRHGILANEGIG